MEGRCVSAIDWGAHGHVMNVRRGTIELLPQGSLMLKAGDMLYVLTEEGELGALERAAREASGGFSRD